MLLNSLRKWVKGSDAGGGRSRRRVASGKNKDDDKHTEHGTEHPLRLALTGQSFLLRAFSGNVWPTEPFDDAERGVAAR